MVKITDENEENIFTTLDKEGKPEIETLGLQIHFNYPCGCKITQDKSGNYFFPCKDHLKLQ